jgi:hypothetical protein
LTQSDYVYSATATGGTTITLLDSACGAVYKGVFDTGDEDNPIDIGNAITCLGKADSVCVAISYYTASTGFIWYVEMTEAEIAAGGQYEDGNVLTGGGNSVTLTSDPSEDTSFWEQGEIKMTSGANNGERRQIFGHSGSGRTFAWALPKAVLAGDGYDIYPGCDGLAVTCRDKFGNKTNFRGFPYIPRQEETVWR